MKWNNNIRYQRKRRFDKDNVRIYCISKVINLRLEEGKSPTIKEFSLMKQENIRMALLERKQYKLKDMKLVVEQQCGYCTTYLAKSCEDCPIREKLGRKCYHLNGYKDINYAETYNKFAKAHKVWCIKIGLWKEDWV